MAYISEYDGSRFGYEEERDSYDMQYEALMEPDWQEEERAEAMAFFACELDDVERALKWMGLPEQASCPCRKIVMSLLSERQSELTKKIMNE